MRLTQLISDLILNFLNAFSEDLILFILAIIKLLQKLDYFENIFCLFLFFFYSLLKLRNLVVTVLLLVIVCSCCCHKRVFFIIYESLCQGGTITLISFINCCSFILTQMMLLMLIRVYLHVFFIRLS
jgi:hypothetical protein